jgi:2-hydroxy-3-keto-5-methylthiopentenyl-1-phosphate phosphatase
MGDSKAPEMEQRRRSIVIDFDGTITQDDLLDQIARDFGDPAVYQEVEDALHAGTMTLREVITREYAPVTTPMPEAVAWVLERVRVRPGFADLVHSAQRAGWEVHVVSSGFEEFIQPVLEREGVDVPIHANRVDARPDGWVVEWRYPESCDHCHESCKRELLPSGYVVYIGDGYSDRCAAMASDRVFAMRGLARYLAERGIAFDPFDDFRDVSRALAAELATPVS